MHTSLFGAASIFMTALVRPFLNEPDSLGVTSDLDSQQLMRSSSKIRAVLFGVSLLLGLELLLRVVVPEHRLLFAFEHQNGLIGVLGDQVYVRSSGTHHGTDGPYAFEIQTNSLGLRDDAELSVQKSAGQDLYLALGDSWIFGTSLTQDATIPERMERRLAALTGRPTTVINAGVPGGSAFELLARWVELKDRAPWTGLILGIPHNVGRQHDIAGIRSGLFHPDRGAPYVDWRTYLVLRRLIAPYTRPLYAPSTPPRDSGMLDDVVMLVSQARAAGLSITVIEDPGHMNDALGAVRVLDSRWRAALHPFGAVFAGHSLNTRDCWGYGDVGHPGEAGAHAIAHVVAQAMVAGTSAVGLQSNPRCSAVEGVGPGKPGSPVVP
jgi:hypothetical protein